MAAVSSVLDSSRHIGVSQQSDLLTICSILHPVIFPASFCPVNALSIYVGWGCRDVIFRKQSDRVVLK